mmetsp:Transcript_3822/g.9032  ORF Transcript_3822/g.9032 Transcript_3822/m.9032 type:complete len:216 (-) Transcript_3822:633-1280(-)
MRSTLRAEPYVSSPPEALGLAHPPSGSTPVLPQRPSLFALTRSSSGPCAKSHLPFLSIGHDAPLLESQCWQRRVLNLGSAAALCRWAGNAARPPSPPKARCRKSSDRVQWFRGRSQPRAPTATAVSVPRHTSTPLRSASSAASGAVASSSSSCCCCCVGGGAPGPTAGGEGPSSGGAAAKGAVVVALSPAATSPSVGAVPVLASPAVVADSSPVD